MSLPSSWPVRSRAGRHAVVALVATSAVMAPLSASGGTAQEATAHVAPQTGLDIRDRVHDGQPDIVRMTIRRSRSTFAVVRIKVRGVRSRAISNEMLLFVDPSGRRERPSYGIALPLDGASEYNLAHTQGWRFQRRRSFNCGESVRLFEPRRTVRLVRFRLPAACFGDHGARFAAKTQRFNAGGAMRNPDWTPRRRTLSRTFHF